MKRTNKKSYKTLVTILIISLFVIGGAYALLTDSVVLEGTATIKEVDNVSLEITNVEWIDSFDNGGGITYEPISYDIAADHKSFSVNLGTIRVDENGKICAIDGYQLPIDNYLGATFKVTVTNKGNKPTIISTGASGAASALGFKNYEDDFSIDNEILAPGASCTFYIVYETANEPFVSGQEVWADFSIIGTEYTGEETPLETHVHSALGGV